ncbi:MAG: SDR family oxidoreductase [Candidatus Brocadiia bacterium]|jgi:NAD(P)-dependent dehydrogenase (short-subunit alcohol dehydrogenase family)
MSDVIRPPQGPCDPDLKGQSALVTGGGSGIGRGICLRLGAEGMRVFLCGRSEKDLQETAELGWAGVPAEIAACVAFLAGAQAEYIAGQTICVDAGATTQPHPRGAPL